MTLVESLIHAQMEGKRLDSYNAADDDIDADIIGGDDLAELLAEDDEDFDWRGEGD